jgi:hypothetical protein
MLFLKKKKEKKEKKHTFKDSNYNSYTYFIILGLRFL